MFVPRHPVVANQFCEYASQTSVTGGAGNVLAYAGSACYLDDSQTEATVKIFAADESKTCFGFLMQKVKTGYHSVHPVSFVLPGDLGSSDVIAQPSYNTNGVINGTKSAPVGVGHLGIWDTIHYHNGSNALNAGTVLGVRKNSMSELTGQGGDMNSLTANTTVAVVLKGASAAQVTANQNNTTLYPIRIKLLV